MQIIMKSPLNFKWHKPVAMKMDKLKILEIQPSKQYNIGKRQIDQWNIIKSPEINLYKYSELIFNKEAKVL